MKKGSLIVLMAVCFASLSFTPVSKNTEISKMVKKVSEINGLKDPNVIYPGQTLIFPFPKSEDRLFVNVHKSDCLWNISKNLIGDLQVAQLPVVQPVPAPAPAPVIPENKNSGFDWFWPFIILFVLFLATLFYTWRNFQKEEEKRKIAEANEQEKKRLERELEATKNKLPIVAPPVATTEWLRNNNPVGGDITNSSAFLAQMTIAKVLGKKPGLIVQAIVSTGEGAIKMSFSHGRTTKTGLSKVSVYMGWDWDTKKSEWAEVGMIASICSNGFEVSPEKVVPMNQLFTSVELVNKDKHPVICDEGAPEGTIYPELVSKLVVKYHENNIKDLRKAGVVMGTPKVLKQEKK